MRQQHIGMKHHFVVCFVVMAFALSACSAPGASKGQTNAATPTNTRSIVAAVQSVDALPNRSDTDAACEFDAAESNAWADNYGHALYTPAEETTSYQMTTTENDCNNLQIGCFRKCWKSALPRHLKHIPKGGGQHYEYCTATYRKAFMDCMKAAGLLVEFSALDIALTWLKTEGANVLGTIVVIGGIAYIVSTGGTGALVLAVL